MIFVDSWSQWFTLIPKCFGQICFGQFNFGQKSFGQDFQNFGQIRSKISVKSKFDRNYFGQIFWLTEILKWLFICKFQHFHLTNASILYLTIIIIVKILIFTINGLKKKFNNDNCWAEKILCFYSRSKRKLKTNWYILG